jgi:hypothetical protein
VSYEIDESSCVGTASPSRQQLDPELDARCGDRIALGQDVRVVGDVSRNT